MDCSGENQKKNEKIIIMKGLWIMVLKGWGKKFKWVPYVADEKDEMLGNPYCGLYKIYRFYASPDKNEEENIKLEDTVICSEHQICLIEINLINYNDRPLADDALKNIENIFRYFISHKKQLIVRFLYDWEGKGIMYEPNDISIILGHMEQLSGILKSLERYIYIIQGLFIGSWGEMHNSRYLSERHIITLAKKIYECTGCSTQIALRCPSFWRMITKTSQPLDEKSAFTETYEARFSLYNDGMLASETDFGTYGHMGAKDAKNHSDKWLRRDELDFQTNLCRFVSNGGEVINNCSFNDAGPAVRDLRKMRVSYLHCDHDRQVLEKWKHTKSGMTDPLWKNKSVYEYITAHLGYRFLIKDVKVTVNLSRIKVAIKLINTGFAPCYHKFDVKIALAGEGSPEYHEYFVDTDTRLWFPDEPVDLVTVIQAKELKESNYIICFGIYDNRTRQLIKIANDYDTETIHGYYKLGCLVINTKNKF